MPTDRVNTLVRLAKECGKLNELAVNGDPHPRVYDKTDKIANAKRWEQDLNGATAELERFAQQYGFTSVVYTGIGPTLKKGETFVEIPY